MFGMYDTDLCIFKAYYCDCTFSNVNLKIHAYNTFLLMFIVPRNHVLVFELNIYSIAVFIGIYLMDFDRLVCVHFRP